MWFRCSAEIAEVEFELSLVSVRRNRSLLVVVRCIEVLWVFVWLVDGRRGNVREIFLRNPYFYSRWVVEFAGVPFYFDILRLFGLAFSLYTCGFLGYFGFRFSTTFSRISFFMLLPVGTLIGKGGIDWLIDGWLIDWLIDVFSLMPVCLVDWPTDGCSRSVHSYVFCMDFGDAQDSDFLVEFLFRFLLSEWLIDWLIDWSIIDWLLEFPYGLGFVRLIVDWSAD